MSYDNKTKLIERKTLRHDDIDDHNAMSVNVLSDGRIMCICAGHGTTNFNHIFISKNRESIGEFGSEQQLAIPSEYISTTYAQALFANGKWHLFFRCSDASSNYYWGYRNSADGITWSDAQIWLSSNMQYYCKIAVLDNTTLKFVCCSNASLEQTDLRLGFINLVSGSITAPDGTVLGNINTITTPIVYTAVPVLVSKGSSKIRLFDVTQGDETAIAYCTYTTTSDAVNHVAFYNSDTHVATIVDLAEAPGVPFGPNYQNGICFTDAHTIIVCRHIGVVWTVEKYSNVGTGVFALVCTLATSINDQIKLMRPQVAKGDPAQVIWNKGYYNPDTFADYDTDIDGALFPKLETSSGFDSYTKSLVLFNGEDGKSIFVDETGKVWTASGTAVLSNKHFVDGISSGHFDGNSDYIVTPNSDDFNFGAEPFTIDCWVWPDSTLNGTWYTIFHIGADVDNRISLYYAVNVLTFICVIGGVQKAYYQLTGAALQANAWNHVAVVRNGTSLILFLNGKTYQTTVIAAIGSNAMINSSAPAHIGVRKYAGSEDRYFHGYIDDFRVSKGIARWSGTFNPGTYQ